MNRQHWSMIIISCLDYVYVYMYGYVYMYFTNIEYSHFCLFTYIFTFGNTYAWCCMPDSLQDFMALRANFQKPIVKLGLRLRSEKNTKDFDGLSLKLNCAEKL